jgi:hypothetical protein
MQVKTPISVIGVTTVFATAGYAPVHAQARAVTGPIPSINTRQACTSSARPIAIRTRGHLAGCKVDFHFPHGWTLLEPPGTLAQRMRPGGVRTAADRSWATRLAAVHNVVGLANGSGASSPRRMWTSALVDCGESLPWQSTDQQKAKVRRSI